MPHTSTHQELLDNLNLTALHVMHVRDWNHDMELQANKESDANESNPSDYNSDNDILELINISPPSPILLFIFLNILNSESKSDS